MYETGSLVPFQGLGSEPESESMEDSSDVPVASSEDEEWWPEENCLERRRRRRRVADADVLLSIAATHQLASGCWHIRATGAAHHDKPRWHDRTAGSGTDVAPINAYKNKCRPDFLQNVELLVLAAAVNIRIDKLRSCVVGTSCLR